MKRLREMVSKNMNFYGFSYEELSEALGKKPDAIEKAITTGSISFRDLKKLVELLKFTAAQKAYIFS